MSTIAVRPASASSISISSIPTLDVAPSLEVQRWFGSPQPLAVAQSSVDSHLSVHNGFLTRNVSRSESASKHSKLLDEVQEERSDTYARQVATTIRKSELFSVVKSSAEEENFIRQESISTELIRPPHDNQEITPGILHFGAGHFALSHLASYIDHLLGKGHLNWGIVAVSFRSGAFLKQIEDSNGRHLLLERHQGQPTKAHMIRAICNTVLPNQAHSHVPHWIADPRIRLITLTVTINGYYFVGPQQDLNIHHPDIQHDLRNPHQPKTIYGYLAVGLSRRAEASKEKTRMDGRLVILPLDNVEHCGHRFRSALQSFMKESSSELASTSGDLAQWVTTYVDVLNSMVDRITPNLESSLAQKFRDRWGVQSNIPVVVTEPYKELVHTRPSFPDCLPPWKSIGVKIVASCDDDWRRKGYLLNGVHHALAIMARRVGGIEMVHEAIQNTTIRTAITCLQDDYCIFLTACSGDYATAQQYAHTIRERCANSACPDTIDRIGTQSTRKTNQRLLGCLLDMNTRMNAVPSAITLVIATWMMNLMAPSENTLAQSSSESNLKLTPVDTDGQMYPTIVSTWSEWPLDHIITETEVSTMLKSIEENSGFPLFLRAADHAPFLTKLTQWLQKLKDHGLEYCVNELKPSTSADAQITHILLDCDGTLVDSEGIAFGASVELVNSWLRDHNVSTQYTSEELQRKFVGSSFNKIISQLTEMHNLTKLTDDELQQLTQEEDTLVTRTLAKSVQPCEGVQDAISYLQSSGFQISVVTSSSGPRVKTCLDVTGLYTVMSAPTIYSAVTSLPTTRSKPDPTIYLKSIIDQQTLPFQCIAVEDSVSGATAAVRAGCVTIGYLGTHPPEQRADQAKKLLHQGVIATINSWSELKTLMHQRNWDHPCRDS